MNKMLNLVLVLGLSIGFIGCGIEEDENTQSSSDSSASFELFDDGLADYYKEIYDGAQSIRIKWTKRTDYGTFLTVTPEKPIDAVDAYYLGFGSGKSDDKSFLIYNGTSKRTYTIDCSPVSSVESSNYATPNTLLVKFRCEKEDYTVNDADFMTDFSFVMPMDGSKLEVSELGKTLTYIAPF